MVWMCVAGCLGTETFPPRVELPFKVELPSEVEPPSKVELPSKVGFPSKEGKFPPREEKFPPSKDFSKVVLTPESAPRGVSPAKRKLAR